MLEVPADQCSTTVEVEFDSERERVVAIKRTRWQDLVLEATPAAVPASDATAELLASEAASRLDMTTLLNDDAREFLTTVSALTVC